MGREHSSWVMGILGVGKLMMVRVVGTSNMRCKELFTRGTGARFLSSGDHNPHCRRGFTEATIHGVLPNARNLHVPINCPAYQELLKSYKGGEGVLRP